MKHFLHNHLFSHTAGPVFLTALIAGAFLSPAVAKVMRLGTITKDNVAQPITTNTTVGGDPVQPTVTPEMGDVGGKYYGGVPDPVKVKHYYIAAESVLWDFAPEGQDPVCGKSFTNSLLLNRVAWKVRYVEYADSNFSARVLPTDRLGILGPVLRGTVGQYIEVTFLNRAWLPLSMHPHGVRYDKDSEGSYYSDGSGLGAAVAPGAKFTYVWYLDPASGPLPTEPSSKGWLYHSHVGGDDDIDLGLVGSIIVTDPARARADGTPKDVDREEMALFMLFDGSNYAGGETEEPDERPISALAPGAQGAAPQPSWAEVQEFAEEAQRHTINGLTYGNLRGLDMNEGEHVRWYLFGLGSESDLHSAHWHGMTVVEDGQRRTDVVELLPGSMKVADMVADNPGTWLFHCHVGEHMANGMFARMNVHPTGHNEVSQAPETAFFGMPQSLQTLHLQPAQLAVNGANPGKSELDIDGKVTVPDPFTVAGHDFTVTVGKNAITFHPDASGVCATPDGFLLIKNLSPYGNGIVRDGTLEFELNLKGSAWISELERMHLRTKDAIASGAKLPIVLAVGNAEHSASTPLVTAN